MVLGVITFLIMIQIWKTQIQDLQLGWDIYQMLNRVVQLFFFTLSLQSIQARFENFQKQFMVFWKKFLKIFENGSKLRVVQSFGIIWIDMVILTLEHFMLPVLSFKGTNGSPRRGFATLKTRNLHFDLSDILFMKLKKEILNNQGNIIPTLSIIKSKPTIWPTIDCQSSENVSIN